MVPADYVHRIGRTGRAGVTGDAISLVCVDERPLLRDIERLLGAPIPTQVIDGFTPDPAQRAEPIRLRSGQGGGGRPPRRPMAASHAGAPTGGGARRGRPPRRNQRPGGHGASIGNRSSGGGRWASLPGERTRR